MQINDLARKRVKLLHRPFKALWLLFLPLGGYRPPARSAGRKGLACDHAQVVPHFRPQHLPGCLDLRGNESALRRVPTRVEFEKWVQLGVLEEPTRHIVLIDEPYHPVGGQQRSQFIE
jgi:hypothetical protein